MNWLIFKKRILIMRITFQPSHVIALEKGAYYIRKGSVYQVGQPFKTPKKKLRYIENLYFNFKTNSITASFSNKPIKGLTQLFNDK